MVDNIVESLLGVLHTDSALLAPMLIIMPIAGSLRSSWAQRSGGSPGAGRGARCGRNSREGWQSRNASKIPPNVSCAFIWATCHRPEFLTHTFKHSIIRILKYTAILIIILVQYVHAATFFGYIKPGVYLGLVTNYTVSVSAGIQYHGAPHAKGNFISFHEYVAGHFSWTFTVTDVLNNRSICISRFWAHFDWKQYCLEVVKI